jgi:hypothetical protein
MILLHDILKRFDVPDLDRDCALRIPLVERHTTLLHHLLKAPVTRWIGYRPAQAEQNHIDRKPHPREVQPGYQPVCNIGSPSAADNPPAYRDRTPYGIRLPPRLP